MLRTFFLFLLLCLATVGRLASAARSNTGTETAVKPFFAQHCTKCHGAKKQKGDLRVDRKSWETGRRS